MTFHWILMAILYAACWVYFGLATLRRGHYWLLWIGFIFRFLWTIGGFDSPDRTRRRGGIGARSRKHIANGPRRKSWTLAFNPGW